MPEKISRAAMIVAIFNLSLNKNIPHNIPHITIIPRFEYASTSEVFCKMICQKIEYANIIVTLAPKYSKKGNEKNSSAEAYLLSTVLTEKKKNNI
jgi:glycogen synthase